MVKNKVTAIHRIVAIHVDVATVLVVRLSNVSCIIVEPRRKLLVGFRDEGRVAVSCLTAQKLVLISSKVDTLVAAGGDRGRINDCDSGRCTGNLGRCGDIGNGGCGTRVRGHSGVRGLGCGGCADDLSFLQGGLNVHSSDQARDSSCCGGDCAGPCSGDRGERDRSRSCLNRSNS